MLEALRRRFTRHKCLRRPGDGPATIARGTRNGMRGGTGARTAQERQHACAMPPRRLTVMDPPHDRAARRRQHGRGEVPRQSHHEGYLRTTRRRRGVRANVHGSIRGRGLLHEDATSICATAPRTSYLGGRTSPRSSRGVISSIGGCQCGGGRQARREMGETPAPCHAEPALPPRRRHHRTLPANPPLKCRARRLRDLP